MTWSDLVAWESHLRDGSERVRRDGRGGGMHKKGQMVPLGAWWLMGVFTEVTGGWVQISIVTTLLSQWVPASMEALLT